MSPYLDYFLPLSSIVMAAIAAASVGVTVALLLAWPALARYFRAPWPKLVIELAQVLSGIVALLYSLATTAQARDKLWPALLGIGGVFGWKVVQWICDWKSHKQSEDLNATVENLAKEVQKTTEEANSFVQLLSVFAAAVFDKRMRIEERIKKRTARKPSVPQCIDALAPDQVVSYQYCSGEPA